jgi:hypothetical protein
VTDEPTAVFDLRIELSTALAPVLDLMRENNVLLRDVLRDLQELRTRVASVEDAVGHAGQH